MVYLFRLFPVPVTVGSSTMQEKNQQSTPSASKLQVFADVLGTPAGKEKVS